MNSTLVLAFASSQPRIVISPGSSADLPGPTAIATMDSVQEEATTSFMSLAGCDAEFARSFLEASGWNLELAVASLYGEGATGSGLGGGLGSGGGGSGGGGDANGGGGDGGSTDAGPGAFNHDTSGFGMQDPLAVRAPIAQFNDTLMGDPAQAVPRRGPTNAADHPLEAFRDFRSEGALSSGHGDTSSGDVFGMPKRPKNLSEIYRPPTELCFVGSFEELRLVGRQQGRWILVNIQSPTEFASQQLNADTWSDESLQAVIESSFLFWQRYFDSDDGSMYCRHYLAKWPTYPHIGLVDPVTGQLVKRWSGFVSSERLIDKLMEYADAPPKDFTFDSDPPQGQGGGSADGIDAEMVQALAMSMESSGAAPAALEPTAAPPPLAEKAWPPPPGCPEGGASGSVVVRLRLPNGENFTQAFWLEHTLRDLCSIVHHQAGVTLSTSKLYQLATHGSPPFTNMDGSLSSFGLSGRVALTLSEQD